MSSIIGCLVLGELQQMSSAANGTKKAKEKADDQFSKYLDKTFNKTASLMAFSSKAVAQLALEFAGNPEEELWLAERAFLYGKNLGIGLQSMDDLLDFIASEEELGKPAGADQK